MALALLLIAASPALPEMLAVALVLCCAAILAEGGPGLAASEAGAADLMLDVHGWV